MSGTAPNPDPDRLDPVYVHGLREFWVILAAWGICLIWSVGYCYVQGYRPPGESVELTLGMPRWVFWGVLFPWILATIFSVGFGLFWVVDEPLGEDEQEPDD